MSILPALYEAYASRGLTLLSGLTPARYNGLKQAAFTWLIRDGKSVTDGYGISLNEVQMLEAVLPAIAPKNIFIIGNSYGFSTLAIALICPKSKVVAIDAGVDTHSEKGLELTRDLAKSLGLKNVTVLLATSPQDVPSVVKKHLGGHIDFAFIDGLHTNTQVVIDAEALKPFTKPATALLFHDVLEFGLQQGLHKIENMYGTTAHIMHATTSGMALICAKPGKALLQALLPFCPTPETLTVPHGMLAWKKHQKKGKTLRRLTRSLRKKLGLKTASKPTFHTGRI
ncbi:MAG: hypothetical protein COY40_06435 [Alphaproteobacteria bacterium CG_4_10_14_0_8_um_filter_53_9]|nr:MAG: hypothetical protein COY40_06435 [Alphaproteobacteria bacterium CG_4_10_14_0_8_um_filter_53_9]